MKEFVEKLIGRLEECKKIEKCNLYSGIEEGFGYSHCSDAFEDGQTLGAFNAYSSMLDFIKELAEEYFNCSTNISTNISTTNAERIRSMSDEELAEFLYGVDHFVDDGQCMVCFEGIILNDDKADILDWLQSEVKGSDV